MTPQELKNSILQLAVQGKLVEQRAEEGTAEELYKKIQAEKQKLTAEKKIKKEKPLPEITAEEIPFEIPESWKWVRLGEIGYTQTGNTPSKNHPEYFGDYIPFITPGDINNCIVNYENRKISFLGESVARLTYEGSVLQVCIGGSIGKACVIDRKVSFNQQINAVYPYICVSNYILYVLISNFFILKIKEFAGGTATPIINKGLWDKLLIPLPPLAEQKRIVAKIEELLPQIDRYEKAWSKLEEFNKRFPDDMQKSILQYAVQGKLVEQRVEEGTAEELYKKIQAEKQKLIAEKKIKKEKPLPEITAEEIPFDIPESWKWVRLGEIGFTNIGLTYKPKDVCSENGTIVLRSSNIQNGKLIFNDIVRVSTNIPDNKMCQKDDILICARNGSKRLVGKAAIIDKNGMSFGAFMAVFRSICNHYILYIINSAYFRNTLLKDTGTTTINQITQEMLRTFLVPLPPLEEQKRIVDKIEELLPLCEKLKK